MTVDSVAGTAGAEAGTGARAGASPAEHVPLAAPLPGAVAFAATIALVGLFDRRVPHAGHRPLAIVIGVAIVCTAARKVATLGPSDLASAGS